ncbi:hypothetical protein FA95DRAFT_1613462 [Auriscalpium vulgare]|uniref:Uncharacterized protein n=1 Tax=Auriscalpium vulgare TaxID=40419 RepID=A0ACB8R2J0_9AGAM|nr:hypothetical protein FA95DRAFT_1613462 [Auriscalpium vulgare]
MSAAVLAAAQSEAHAWLRIPSFAPSPSSPPSQSSIMGVLPTFAFRHQPLKALYYTFLVLSLFVRLPFWILISAVPAWRPRRSWSLKRAVLVRLFKLVVESGFVVDPFLTRVDVSKKAKDPDRVGMVWVDGVPPELVVGEVKEAARVNKVEPATVPGFWYGKRSERGYGYPAEAGEKVLYALHGGSYTDLVHQIPQA